MSQRTGIGAAVVAALVTVSALGAGALATGAQTQETDTAETIDSCTTITDPGRYVLAGDIENANGTCIRIQSSDVVLDGNGHTIAGVTNESRREEFREATMAPSVVFSDNETAENESLVAEVVANYPWPTNPRWANIGVAANGSDGLSNVTVRDLTVREFAFGVYYDGVADGRIENVTAAANGDGIDVFNATDTTVADVALTDNQYGLFALNVTGGTIGNATAEGNAVSSLAMFATPGIEIDGASIAGTPAGVILMASDDSRIVDSSITGSAYTGVGVLRSDGVLVANTTVANTTGDVPSYLEEFPPPFEAPAGINLDDAGDGIVRDATLTDNADWALHATNGSSVAGERVALDGTTVGFDATDAALNAADDAPADASEGRPAGDGLLVTNTSATASLTLSVAWDAEPSAEANATATQGTPADLATADVTPGAPG